MTTGGVLGHQGGWDELLLILTPVAAFGALLWVAITRAERARSTEAAGHRPPEATRDADRTRPKTDW